MTIRLALPAVLALAAGALLHHYAIAREPAMTGPRQTIEEIAPSVFAAFAHREAGMSANSGFVIGRNAVWAFDAQRVDFSTELLQEIRKRTSAPVRYLIHSHHHREIVEGQPAFADATVVGHAGMRRHLIEEPRPNVRPPDLTYESRLTFYDGDRELQLIHLGRYHTSGDSVLFLPRERVLFAGDLLPGIGGPGGMRQAYLTEFPDAIDRALALDFDLLVPGRGNTVATKDDLRRFKAYLGEVLESVQRAIDAGATLDEARATIPVPEYIDPARLETESFKRLWGLTIDRAYAELTANTPAR